MRKLDFFDYAEDFRFTVHEHRTYGLIFHPRYGTVIDAGITAAAGNAYIINRTIGIDGHANSQLTGNICTGSGYFTALLASQAGVVVTVELHADLKDQAEQKFRAHGLTNIQTRLGDAARDWSEDGAFDVIVLTGSTPLPPEAFLKRLNPGGRLFALVGEGVIMSARLVTATAAGVFRADNLFETRAKALQNAPQPARFTF